MTPEHIKLAELLQADLTILYESNLVADWAMGEVRRFRSAAAEMDPSSIRTKILQAALCRLEEADMAMRAAEAAARRIGPLLDKLVGSEGEFERRIVAALEADRAGEIEPGDVEAREPGRLDS